MKKFLSLLCAVAIVLGASAAPVAKKAGVVKFQRAAVEKLRTEKKSLAKKSVKKDARTLVLPPVRQRLLPHR